MKENIKIAKVWHICNNELKCSNKKVATTTYNNVEIATLKEDRNYEVQQFLIKDKNNEYWKLGIAPIRLNLFIGDTTSYLSAPDKIEQYRKDITEAYKKLDLKAFWQKKINEKRYFNKCELEYIHRYYPDIYEKAKESRKAFEEKRNTEQEQSKLERKQYEQEKVKTTNAKFEKALSELKYKIFIGEMVTTEDFEFYKDNKYENGKTIQNNILYLAKHYGIEIPLATQGFINNRLKSYNFKTGDCFYTITDKNKKCSTKMEIYLQQILEKVQEEYREKFKSKIQQMQGTVRERGGNL